MSRLVRALVELALGRRRQLDPALLAPRLVTVEVLLVPADLGEDVAVELEGEAAVLADLDKVARWQNLIPSFPWIAPPHPPPSAPKPYTLAQSKERKGSNFAIWQPCQGHQDVRVGARLRRAQRQGEGEG